MSAPAEKTVIEQAEENLATVKEQAIVAVAAANQKLLEVAGAKSNTELLTSLHQQGETYVTQVKGTHKLNLWLEISLSSKFFSYVGYVDQLTEQTASSRTQVDSTFSSLLKGLSDLTAEFLSNNDPAQADKLKNTFDNVLTQTNELNKQLKEQGSAAQEALSGTVGKLYEKTVDTAKTIATQLDEKKP